MKKIVILSIIFLFPVMAYAGWGTGSVSPDGLGGYNFDYYSHDFTPPSYAPDPDYIGNAFRDLNQTLMQKRALDIQEQGIALRQREFALESSILKAKRKEETSPTSDYEYYQPDKPIANGLETCGDWQTYVEGSVNGFCKFLEDKGQNASRTACMCEEEIAKQQKSAYLAGLIDAYQTIYSETSNEYYHFPFKHDVIYEQEMDDFAANPLTAKIPLSLGLLIINQRLKKEANPVQRSK